ncbi:MAG: PIN domain-containing protein [Candidatus Micrarchaeota archaeon]
MEKICLDTDVVFDFLKGEKSIVEKLRYYSAREEICVSSLTLFEIMTTIKKQEVVFSFVNSLNILDFDKKSATIAARIFDELEEKGMKVTMENMVTAAVCIKNNAFLFTKTRKKYEGIQGLKLV